MSAERNRGGRPSRAPGESMKRLSVMLRPRYRDALELIARDRQTSLSQALEYVIAVVARNYKIEGENVIDIVIPVDEGDALRANWPDVPAPLKELAYLEFHLASNPKNNKKRNDRQLQSSVSGKVLSIPPSLRRPDEAFFVNVYERLNPSGADMDPLVLDAIYQACLAAFQVGLTVDEVMKVVEENRAIKQKK